MKKALKIVVILLAIVGVLSIAAFAFIFYNIKYVDYKYTGEELWNEVNDYRAHIGVQTLELDPLLCKNLVERWWAIKEPGNAHKGLEQWFDDNGISNNPKYGIFGEMYVKDISTPSNAINWWLGSPGHKNTLEMPELTYGCAYANNGLGVVIVASKGENQSQ